MVVILNVQVSFIMTTGGWVKRRRERERERDDSLLSFLRIKIACHVFTSRMLLRAADVGASK